MAAFKSWWDKKDPSTAWTISAELGRGPDGPSRNQIEELSHLFGITKPAALVWGCSPPGTITTDTAVPSWERP